MTDYMLISRAKKNALTGLGLTLLSSLLLTLAGCNPTSDPKVSYQATGSWQGTIGAKRVRGVIAPNGRYQLAVVDAAGAFLPGAGEYVGEVVIVDRENNIGRMSIGFLHPPDNAEVLPGVAFKVGETRLFSNESPYIELSRTSEASSPAAQLDVAGRWSLSVDDSDALPDLTNLIVDAVGNLAGNDGDACLYSGTLKLADPAWNIFQLDLTFSDSPGKSCGADTSPYRYLGLAMTLPPENNRRRLWLAANSWEISGNRTGTFFGNLAATINEAPLAKMTANLNPLDDPVVHPLQIRRNSAVAFSAQGSSDPNNDPLTYGWSVTDGAGNDLFQGTGSSVNFTPASDMEYTVNLTVNDGTLSAALARTVKVEWLVDRFVDCTNGTVLDTTTNLFWLKDAGCDELHYATPDYYWVNLATAKAKVAALASPGCGLSDGSVAMDWRLPKREVEFESLVVQKQWQEGSRFINVGKNPYAPLNIWIYWTSDEDGIGNYVDFGYQEPDPWFGFMFIDNNNAVWPVRNEISAVAGAEVEQCLQAAAPP